MAFSSVCTAQGKEKYILGLQSSIANKNCLEIINCEISSPYEQGFFDDLYKVLNIEFTLETLPIKRLYLHLLKTQSIDFKYPDNPNWNKQQKQGKKVYYSILIRKYIDATFVRQENQNLTLSAVKTLGIIRGYTPESYAKEIKNGQIKLLYFERKEQLIAALIAKRIDAIYLNQDLIHSYRKEVTNNLPVKLSDVLPRVTGNYHISTINHPAIISKINQYLTNRGID
ncbi:transporter substrate-binding domain-containing protein [Colwelliaceae bacterium 6441]